MIEMAAFTGISGLWCTSGGGAFTDLCTESVKHKHHVEANLRWTELPVIAKYRL